MKDADLVISGDVLFQGGIGRTDLIGGDQETLLTSIHEKLAYAAGTYAGVKRPWT